MSGVWRLGQWVIPLFVLFRERFEWFLGVSGERLPPFAEEFADFREGLVLERRVGFDLHPFCFGEEDERRFAARPAAALFLRRLLLSAFVCRFFTALFLAAIIAAAVGVAVTAPLPLGTGFRLLLLRFVIVAVVARGAVVAAVVGAVRTGAAALRVVAVRAGLLGHKIVVLVIVIVVVTAATAAAAAAGLTAILIVAFGVDLRKVRIVSLPPERRRTKAA